MSHFASIAAKGSTAQHAAVEFEGTGIPACAASADSKKAALKKEWKNFNSPITCGRKACDAVAQVQAEAYHAAEAAAKAVAEAATKALASAKKATTKPAKAAKAETVAEATPAPVASQKPSKAKIIASIKIRVEHTACEHDDTYEARVLCRKEALANVKKGGKVAKASKKK